MEQMYLSDHKGRKCMAPWQDQMHPATILSAYQVGEDTHFRVQYDGYTDVRNFPKRMLRFSENDEKRDMPPETKKSHEPERVSEENFLVEVREPTKRQDLYSSYMVYKVVSSGKGADKGKEIRMFRRYSDFLWLRERLEEKYPGYLIPPIPEKAVVGNYQQEFINSRMRGLEKFLQRLVGHSTLGSDPLLDMFLHTEKEFSDEKSKTQKTSTNSAFSMISGFGSAMITPFVSAPPQKKTETANDAVCDEISLYARKIHSIFKSLHTSSTELMRREKASSKAWFEFGQHLMAFGKCEKESGDGKNSELGDLTARIAKCCDRMSVLGEQRVDLATHQLVEPMKDYILVVEALKKMMSNRQEHEAALSACKRKKAYLAKSNRNIHIVSDKSARSGNDAAVTAAEKDAKDAESKVQGTMEDLDKMSATVFKEVERFNLEKEKELRSVMEKFVKGQIDDAKRKQEAWQSIMAEIEEDI
eukprot:CAMPEP_0114496932 /NCGR_PEP_ID=MMETSP0109-20121206/6038_1 /TAXON_ID=29199 /ORGANISM="Chlorarachnion reptans, Strain CCCM449" /LENGTH=472 /DNA_ID=CAMNT_0001674247 /DNA_START=214 /DNA_END=1632 /DNA_ORIENTATION=-